MPPYRNRVWPIIFAAMAALLAVFASRAFRAAHYQGRKAIDKKAFHVVSLQLPGAPERVKGLVVSRAPYGLGRGDLMEPQQITIRTDDGWSMTLLGRSSTISMWRNRVSAIYIRRPLEPVRFLQAKADLLSTLSQLGIQPDLSMQNEISTWTDDAPGNGEVPGLMPYDWKTGIRTPFHGLVLDVRMSADPDHGWYYLLIFSAVDPDLMAALSPATQPSAQPADNDPVASTSVKVMGTPADIRGAEVHVPKAGMGEADLLEPQNLTLTLPDEKQISITARSSNVMFSDGIAHGVFIRRPMKPLPFKEAKDDLMRTLSDLHLDPDHSMQSATADWPQDADNVRRPSPGLQDYQTGFAKPIHGATLTLRLCPDPKGGWYYLLIFSVGSTRK